MTPSSSLNRSSFYCGACSRPSCRVPGTVGLATMVQRSSSAFQPPPPPPAPPSLSLPFPGLMPPAALGEVRGLCVAPCLEEQVSDDRPSACLTVHDSHGHCGTLKLFFRTGSDLVKLDTRYKKYPQQGILSCSLERVALPYSNLEYHPVHFCQGC